MDPESRRVEQTRTGAVPWTKWGPYLTPRQCASCCNTASAVATAGLSDQRRLVGFAIVLWTGKSPDARRCHDHVVSTPTHSYIRYMHQDDCCDVSVEYGKASPEDILAQVTIAGRRRNPVAIHVAATAWFPERKLPCRGDVPSLFQAHEYQSWVIRVFHPEVGIRLVHAEGPAALVFVGSDTEPRAAACYQLTLCAGTSHVLRLRLCDLETKRFGVPGRVSPEPFGSEFDDVMSMRRREAHDYYSDPTLSSSERLRCALLAI